MKKYLILSLFLCFGTANANFSGGYDVSNWSQSLDGGIIDLSGAPDSINLISSNVDNDEPASTDFTIIALNDGVVSFDWSFSSRDEGPGFDPFGWLLNGAFTQLTVDGPNGSGPLTQLGSTMFNVLAGDIFGFSARSIDSCCGAATTTISNFSAPDVSVSAVPVPAAAWLFGSALLGFFGFSRRKVNT